MVFHLSAQVSGFAGSNLLCLRNEVGEAVLKSLAVLVGCVLGEAENRSCQPTIQFTTRRRWWGKRGEEGGNIRRRTSSLQESRLADITLNIHSLLIDLQLRLSDFGLFILAIALRRCLGSLFILVSLSTLLSPRRCFMTYVSHLGGWLGRLGECTGGCFLVTECLYRESRCGIL